MVKINVDAVCDAHPIFVGLGVMAQDYQDLFVFARDTKFPFVDVLIAYLIALIEASIVILEKEFSNIFIESDSLVIILKVQ